MSSGGNTGGAGAKGSSTAAGGTDAASGGTSGGEAGATSGGGSGGTGGGMSALDCPLDCLPPAPSSWTGPSAVYDGPASEQPSTCPNLYSREEVEAHQGMSAAPAACTCPDGVVSDEQCTVTVTRYSSTSCGSSAPGNATDYTIPTESTCISVANTVRLRIAPSEIELGEASCSFGDPTTELPLPTFERVNLACGLPVSAACSANPDCTVAPLPDAPFGRLCIHKDGEHACPGAGYDARFVAYRSIEDDRSCGECSGDPSGGTCGDPNASFMLYYDSECSDPYTSEVQRDVCFDPAGSQEYLDLMDFAPTGVSCAGAATPQGAAMSTGPITFCCVK